MTISTSDAFVIGRHDAHDQAQLVRDGELSASDLVEAARIRIEVLNPHLNAVTWLDFEAAFQRAQHLSTANHALSAVPYLLKDGMDYPGMPSFCGSRARAAAAPQVLGSAYTDRLDAAGLIALGKSNAPEFALLPTTEPLLHGATRNPWNLERSAGGSSGGAAAAVASGMVAIAHVADGGGSIRIPASCCGLFGMKPGRGTNVRARQMHIIEDLLTADAMIGRSVRDVAHMFRATHPNPVAAKACGVSASKRSLRIALIMDNLLGEPPDPEVGAVVRKTADLCADLGHHILPMSLPVDGQDVVTCFRTIWGCLAADIVAQCRNLHGTDALPELLEPWTLELAQWGNQLSSDDIAAMYHQVTRVSDAMITLYRDVDAVLSPVLPIPPVPLGALAPTQPFTMLMRDMFDYVSYTPLHNIAGIPAMSVPLFRSAQGLPVGSMFAASAGGETLLLDLALQLERASPWAQRWPMTAVVDA